MLTTLLVLLLMEWCSGSSAAIQHSRQWQKTEAPCRVTSPFDSPLITAQLERDVEVIGCITNATLPGYGEEVHVVRYHGNTDDNIVLILDDVLESGFERPFMVILVSNVKVYWQVKMEHQPDHLDKHTFVVSKGSGFRFANKKMTTKPTITKPKHVPFDTEALRAWVEGKFSVITSFSSLADANTITLHIGIASSSSLESSRLSSTCELHNNSEGAVNVKAITMATQKVEGCLLTHTTFPKLAYVIELQHVQYETPFEVDLEIQRQSRPSKAKEFWLVLKSPKNVTWRVRTTKVRGFITIAANSFVDMNGIRMRSVNVRSEKLRESGMDLLRWVEYFLDPIAMYVTMNNTNRISITLPHIDDSEERPEDPVVPSSDPSLSQKHVKSTLARSLTTQCDQYSLTVAIDKTLLQVLGILKEGISLEDEHCVLTDNSTHLYIHTDRNACANKIIEPQPGKKMFNNMLVVHSSTTISDSLEDVVEGSGLEDIFSGSGEREATDIVLDDEELELRPLKVGFTCEFQTMDIAIPSSQPFFPQEPTFQLHLFENALFMAPYGTYPVTVSQPHTQLYLQALSTADPYLRAHMANCWLVPSTSDMEDHKYKLVENGCAVESSVQYLLNGLPQSERLRFNLENYVHERVTDRVQLKCQLTLCCISQDCGTYSQRYPVCPTGSTDCDGSPRRHGGHKDASIPATLITLGSLILPQQTSTKYDEDGDSNVKSLSDKSNGDEKSEPAVIEGLDSGTVVGIAFAAFIIGAMMMGSLWFIHTHSGSLFSSGPFKRNASTHETADNEEVYVDTTPGSSAPISA